MPPHIVGGFLSRLNDDRAPAAALALTNDWSVVSCRENGGR
jgi:hypothetical protein